MVGIVKPFVLLALLLAGRALAEDPRVTALVVTGDAEDRAQHAAEALAAFQKAEMIEPKNAGVLLRIAKQFSDLGAAAKAADAAQGLGEKALDYARRAVDLDGKNAKAHLELAVCYGRLTDFAAHKTKLEYSRRMRAAVQRSLELDATDDFAWHVLGRWHGGVANVSVVMKALARLVYDGLPEASNDEAVRAFKKAIELAPQRIIHHAELAKVYAAMGRTELAAQEWQNVLGLKALDGGDENYQRAAKLAVEAQRPGRGFGARMLSAGRSGR